MNSTRNVKAVNYSIVIILEINVTLYINSAKEGMFYQVFVCLFVCLLAG